MSVPVDCMIAWANYYTDARIKNYVDALRRQGHEVEIFALGGQDESVQPGIRLYSVLSKYTGGSTLRYLLSQLAFTVVVAWMVGLRCLRRRYNLVHVHNMPDALVFAAIVPKLLGVKIILDVHDTMPEHYATKFDVPLTHPLIGLMRAEERLSARFADYVITTNDLHKEVLCGHGIPSDKISIIMNVGNERIFRPVPGRAVGAQGERSELALVYHGTIAERLGIDTILKAVALASRDLPGVTLQLIGDGDFMPEVRRLIGELKLQDRVSLLGFVPVEELPQHLAKADVGVVGNRAYVEARQNYMLPVKMLEYAAMEIPTIVPRLRIIARYFDDRTAFFYEPDNAEDMARRIVEAGRHPEVVAAAREHLRSFNQRYNWTVMERRYLSIVEGLHHSSLVGEVR